jgi:predicted nucleic acid-binding protein
MATTAVDKVFVDTNVLVYAQVTLSPLNSAAVTKLTDLEHAGVELWISRQTLREYLSAMTRPGVLTASIPMASLLADVRYFATRFYLAEDGPAVTTNLLNLLASIPVGGKQIHDANLVATMQAHQIPNLLTHNTADFARFAAFITVVPLVP